MPNPSIQAVDSAVCRKALEASKASETKTERRRSRQHLMNRKPRVDQTRMLGTVYYGGQMDQQSLFALEETKQVLCSRCEKQTNTSQHNLLIPGILSCLALRG